MNRQFFILNGNNGGTYIINTSTWKHISTSLSFYQPISFNSKVLKFGLLIFLGLAKLLVQKKLKNTEECEEYLRKDSNSKTTFQLDHNCSILISPTRNKIIVHHHDSHFQKFAFGANYLNVKNEAHIYSLFQAKPTCFQVSRFYDYQDSMDQAISFKLSNENVIAKSEQSCNIDEALSEFFQVSKKNEKHLLLHIDETLSKLNQEGDDTLSAIKKYLINLKANTLDLTFPLGLVHNDFKPWNIKVFDKILIFDFEEATEDGLPMLDIFNFYCDPIIRYKSSNIVYNQIFTEENKQLFKEYKTHLKLEVSTELMFDLYLIERILFWKSIKEQSTSEAFMNLFKFIHPNV